MIISRTPFRVSLFGGGSDYPKWYLKHSGQVLGFTINKYCYITLRRLPPFFDHKHRVAYSKVETVNEISDIQHPAVRAILMEKASDEPGLEIHHDGDLPARSGLGSSSSFTVGMLNAISALQGRMVPRRELAHEALRIEQDVIGEHVGSQDQIWAAYGGFNRIEFSRDGAFEVRSIISPAKRRDGLLHNLQLYFTGISRFSTEISRDKIANMDNREKHIETMSSMVGNALKILDDESRSLSEIGELLHYSWQLKRELADSVSTPVIDEIYDAARDAGAIGGKLLGAGGGGFMLFYVEPDKQAAVKERLKHLIQVNIGLDTAGSKIVVYEPDGLEFG